MTATLAEKVLDALESLDSEVRGDFVVLRDKLGRLELSGELYPSHSYRRRKDLLEATDGEVADQLAREALAMAAPEEATAGFMVKKPVRRVQIKSEVDDSVASTDELKRRLRLYKVDPSSVPRRNRHLDVLYFGRMAISRLKRNDSFKKENWQTHDKVGNCLVELGFVAPLVVDRNYQVIDGNQRLELAKELGMDEVFVIVLDVDGVRADFLRLVLNRSSEFQKWKHPEIDPFLSAHPELQPLLEPLGFFGESVLPVSFFGDTIVSYKIDEYHYQQQAYKQEMGLAKWAELQRERLSEVKKEKEAKRKKTKLPSGLDLFAALAPQEDESE